LAFGPIVWGEILGYLLTVILRLIRKLSYRFKGHDNLHVRSYKEKGNGKTLLELAMLHEAARFHLVIDVIDRVLKLRTKFDF
jgi:xylulose-5-phosphate/fructose-6-phosphate phosphoketolase